MGTRLKGNGATAMMVVYIHHQYPSSPGFGSCPSLHSCSSNDPVSCLARSSAFPWLDLELDTKLTRVRGMRQEHPSKIFEYEIVQETWPFSHSSRMYRRNILSRDRWMHPSYAIRLCEKPSIIKE